ncbi:MAG: type II toxin-antitoxin system RelE/ParE family toxin [Gammaproteobacteria bacterium]|nr:type II toxin-antitoxin system RelE/ParE family toxin [Gammaproteobacteria bacterium]
MATVIYAARALDHLEQAFEFLRRENPAATTAAVRAITSATALLAEHPLAGRRVHGDIRELVVSYGATGFIALYRFVPLRQEVRILAIRHQRMLGYRP